MGTKFALTVSPVSEKEFKRAISNGRIISSDAGHVMYRVGKDLYAMVQDPSHPGGWYRGVDRGHYDRESFLDSAPSGGAS